MSGEAGRNGDSWPFAGYLSRALGHEPGLAVGVSFCGVLRRDDGARPVSVSLAGRGYTGAERIANLKRNRK